MKRILFIITCFTCFSAAAQQGNIWYFGEKAGLDFNTTPPTVLLNGQLDTYEGCASIADMSGNLLFYTDGRFVWNKSHGLMVNGTGLKGDESATQSGIIVPWPGNDSLYLIITADAFQNDLENGYNYSVVNINKNGGQGEVVQKNIRLNPAKCTEKIAITKHANGVNWWVITKEFGNNRFNVYEVTPTGFNLTPVVTDIGPSHTGGYSVSAGCMRSSPDGSKLALAINSFSGTGGFSETNLFDFNTATGVIGNFIRIPGGRPYGVEFSPNSKLLYVSYDPYSSSDSSRIDQFDLSMGSETGIVTSRKKITPTGYKFPCGMQIAPDGKIYVCRENRDSVDVIHNPNTIGPGANFQRGYIGLGLNRRSGMMPPNIISSFLVPVNLSIKIDSVSWCDRTVKFKANSNYTSIISSKWFFGDGDSSILTSPVKTYTTSKDTFIVTVEIKVNIPLPTGGSIIETKTATLTVVFDAKPDVKFGTFTSCGSKQLTLSDSTTLRTGSIGEWYWSFGNGDVATTKSPTYTYPAFGEYTVKHFAKTTHGCPGDTISKTIVIRDKPIAAYTQLGGCRDSLISFQNQSAINAPDNIVRYAWKWGSAGQSSLPNPQRTFPAGTYQVEFSVESDKGCVSDTVRKTMIIEDIPVADFNFKNGCSGIPVAFRDSSRIGVGTIQTWSWDFGDSGTDLIANPAYNYINAGNFNVRLSVTTVNGCKASRIKPISVETVPVAAFNNTKPCLNELINFTDQSSNLTGTIIRYDWNFGNNASSAVKDPVYTYRSPGQFDVKLSVFTANGCTDAVTKQFTLERMNVSAGNDTLVVLNEPFVLMGSGALSYKWTPAALVSIDTIARPTVILNNDQVFNLVGMNQYGCIGTARVSIKAYKGPTIYVPTGFTPNNDGLNDVLRPLSVGINLDRFSVYSRWGVELFTTNTINRGWDGRYQGQLQLNGTYVWYAEGRDRKGKKIVMKGTVNLIR